MECTCPHCGKKNPSENLTFDFTKEFRRIVAFTFNTEPAATKMNIERLFNQWELAGKGPTFLTESELERCTENIQQASSGIRTGTLAVPVPLWISKLEAYRKTAEDLDNDDQNLLEQLKESALLYPIILKIDVQFIKDGEGDIKISSVAGADNRFIARERHCPSCGQTMSYWAGRYPELLLTLLGGPRISKSTALAACAHIFTKNLSNCKITWTGYGAIEDQQGSAGEVVEKGDKNWNNFYRQCLAEYEKNQRVVATKPSGGDPIPRFSVLVTIDNNRHLVLTVVDFPGEYSADKNHIGISDEARVQYAELYKNTDCIWYCTDGAESLQLNISGNEKDMNKYGYDKDKKIFSTAVLTNGMNSFAGMFRENIPVVFLLGKSDAIEGNDDIKDALYQKDYRPGDKWISLSEGYPALLGKQQYVRAHRLCSYLEAYNEILIKKFKQTFPVHTFIATSNYGHGFQGAVAEQDGLSPYQTEVPFLWMLAVYGFLPVIEDDNQVYQAVDPIRKRIADEKTLENLGMCGGSAGGYQSRKRHCCLRKGTGGQKPDRQPWKARIHKKKRCL